MAGRGSAARHRGSDPEVPPFMTGRGRNGGCRERRRSRRVLPRRRNRDVLEDVITYLEMLVRPEGRRVPAPLDKLALMRAENSTASFYRYLYNTVGEPWL